MWTVLRGGPLFKIKCSSSVFVVTESTFLIGHLELASQIWAFKAPTELLLHLIPVLNESKAKQKREHSCSRPLTESSRSESKQ
ncbi:hypothetical protein AAC387_Pa07g3703 [Persea americana]